MASFLRGSFFDRPAAMNDAEYRELTVHIERAALESLARRAAEAREALGRVLQYAPAVKPYYENATAVLKQPDDIIALLTSTRDRRRSR